MDILQASSCSGLQLPCQQTSLALQQMQSLSSSAAMQPLAHDIIPLYQRIFSDQLTPVLAYRCLVEENDINAPSFLLESVVNGNQQGRYSFGRRPASHGDHLQGA